MASKKKATKKFHVSRKQLAETLTELVTELQELDIRDMTISDFEVRFSDLADTLDSLRDDVELEVG